MTSDPQTTMSWMVFCLLLMSALLSVGFIHMQPLPVRWRMTDGPKHTPTVYQPAWNRCFSPRASWAQTGQCAYSRTRPCCQGHGTDWWVVPPHVSTHRARWPLSLWRGKGQPWKLGRWSSYGPCSLVLSICGCRPLALLPLDSLSFRAQVKFYLLKKKALTTFQKGSSICTFLICHLVYFLQSLFVLLFLPVPIYLSPPSPPPPPPFLKLMSWFPVTCIQNNHSCSQ